MMHGETQIKFTDVSVPVIQLPAVFRRVRMERHGSHLTDFYEIWHLNIFLKSVEKIQGSLKSQSYAPEDGQKIARNMLS